MSYFVNAFLISLSEVVRTQILSLRLAYHKSICFFLPLDNGGVQYYFNYKLYHAYYFIVIS